MDDVRLPLTPALSPSEGERESRPPSSRVPEKPRTSDALSLDSNRPTIPPLPLRGGEGAGTLCAFVSLARFGSLLPLGGEGRDKGVAQHRERRQLHGRAACPLTPALSPSEGERESRPPSSRVPEKPRTSDALSLDSNRPTIPPLPLRGGEGAGTLCAFVSLARFGSLLPLGGEGRDKGVAQHRERRQLHGRAACPLTPALSPSEGERESRPPSSRVPEKRRRSDALSLDSNR